MRVTTNGSMYVETPFYCFHTIIVGEDNEIAIVFFTKSNGNDPQSKERVDNFNNYDEELQAAYYLPEKYVIQYNLLDSKYIDFYPTENELKDIEKAGQLLWKKN